MAPKLVPTFWSVPALVVIIPAKAVPLLNSAIFGSNGSFYFAKVVIPSGVAVGLRKIEACLMN